MFSENLRISIDIKNKALKKMVATIKIIKILLKMKKPGQPMAISSLNFNLGGLLPFSIPSINVSTSSRISSW
jgi:hypothetical protein